MSHTTAETPGPANLAYAESLFLDYLRDPASVSPEWREYFAQEARAAGSPPSPRLGPSFRPAGLFDPPNDTCRGGACAIWQIAALQERAGRLVHAYRVRGHLVAHIDPLDRPRQRPPELDASYHGLGDAEMEREFTQRTVSGVERALTLREIIDLLGETYCRSIGVQFMHIADPLVREWLQARMEGTRNRLRLPREEQLRILTELTDAVIFEEFIQRKYIGAKRFSLEGAESLIPLLHLVIEKAGEQGLDEIVMGMAHRGRLNVLANVIGKSPQGIFREFEDVVEDGRPGAGDVKYHVGYTSRRETTCGRKVDISLCFNPSHLEFVNPVAQGRLRAKQERAGDLRGERGMAVLIHGDAALAGQGIVQETLNMSQLPGYAIGGTLHVVVNNQIGFTTSPEESRSSAYATGVAQMLQIPIFHVNGEDPEAVAQVVRLAMDFRAAFHRDVFIDMYGYRRHGHNEGDEPAFTHPALYGAIRRRSSVREGYLGHLLELGGVTRAEADEIARRRRETLERDLKEARSPKYVHRADVLSGAWRTIPAGPDQSVPEVDTGAPPELLRRVLRGLARVPDGFQPHPKLARFLEARAHMAAGRQPLDWAAAEAAALGTLALQGHPVRLSGQDSQRGTFSHRHAVLHDARDGSPFCPLSHLAPEQARVAIVNSPLSEAGVLGFEYGYSMELPEGLTLWEAQFGDFCNAAQVIIDQFISSGEDKWQRRSGLVLLLPHGFEGQGPEHSSARLERFLQLAAEDNIQVAAPTTPAQYFHLLCRQVARPWRKPLVVMTPKSLLRHPRVASPIEELARGRFLRILPDELPERQGEVTRVLLCSGKVYYDLAAYREESARGDAAILRLEQLYPLSRQALEQALAPYPAGTPVFWVQEEPENMGAWSFLQRRFGADLGRGMRLAGVTRPESASPATGSAAMHRLEQAALMQAAFGDAE
ncbi:MAG: 2-oxoglutarate dehydrogenase E1 component [Planctomycetes bacterium]|nr:2-oxoglutarate dehydrogenase E1 component [Planctomycetota bacterium]